jgi:hypothetical protein
MKFRKPTRRQWTIMAVIVAVLACPFTESASDEVVITCVNITGEPMAGVPVQQSWGLYGWGGIGGTETRQTDGTGVVRFPPRRVIGFVGMRIFRCAERLWNDWTAKLMFGGDGRVTERWGPCLGHVIDLPHGFWLPAGWTAEIDPERGLLTPSINAGPHRYGDVRNTSPDHTTAFIGGDQHGFYSNPHIIIRLRKATPAEHESVLANPFRQELLELDRIKEQSQRTGRR